jgi:hypothetical protein
MRIDAASLIAAQSVQRPQKAAPQPPQPADKLLFEPLNFPKTEAGPAAAKPPATAQSAAPNRLGSQLDITI